MAWRMSRKTKRLIGYARISTAGQDLARQLRALKAERCATIFTDTATVKSLEGRPELGRAIAALAPGDVLVLAEWDRATRSMWDGLQIVKQVLDAGGAYKVPAPQLAVCYLRNPRGASPNRGPGL